MTVSTISPRQKRRLPGNRILFGIPFYGRARSVQSRTDGPSRVCDERPQKCRTSKRPGGTPGSPVTNLLFYEDYGRIRIRRRYVLVDHHKILYRADQTTLFGATYRVDCVDRVIRSGRRCNRRHNAIASQVHRVRLSHGHGAWVLRSVDVEDLSPRGCQKKVERNRSDRGTTAARGRPAIGTRHPGSSEEPASFPLRTHGSGHHRRTGLIEQESTVLSTGVEDERNGRHRRFLSRITQHLEDVSSRSAADGGCNVGVRELAALRVAGSIGINYRPR